MRRHPVKGVSCNTKKGTQEWLMNWQSYSYKTHNLETDEVGDGSRVS